MMAQPPGGGGMQEHGIYLGFSVDKQSYNQAVGAIQSFNGLLTQFAASAKKKFEEAALGIVGFEAALEKMRVVLEKAVGGPKHSGTGGSGTSSAAGLAKARSGVKAFAATAVTSFAEAGAAFTGLATTIAGVSIGLLDNLGNQQIQMQMLSRTLWTSQQHAMAYSTSLKVLGASLNQLYLSPTLLKQYQTLNALAMRISSPASKGQTQTVALVQNTSLQIKKMQLEAYYALQWIGYYFAKYMSGPLMRLKALLAGIDKVIAKNMPTWAQVVAHVMQAFMQAGIQIWQALDSVYKFLVKLANYLPTWAKVVGAALLLFSVSNPFTLMLAGLGSVILLFNDFETWLHGGKSALGGFWSELNKVTHGFAAFHQAGQVVVHVVQTLGAGLKQIGPALWGLLKAVGSLIGNLTHSLASLLGLFSGNSTSGITTFGNVLVSVLRLVFAVASPAIRALTGFINIVAGLAKMRPIVAGIAAAFMTWAAIRGILMGIGLAQTLLIKGMYAWEAITKVMMGVQGAFNLLLDANPIGLIVVSVGLLVTGITMLILHWKQFIGWAQKAYNAAAQFIHLPMLIKKVWNPIAGFFKGIWSGITSGFYAVLNGVIGAINRVTSLMNNIPGVHIPTVGTVGSSAVRGGGHAASASAAHHVAHTAVAPTFNRTVHINAPQNNTIHSTQPHATANALAQNYNRHFHNIRGFIL